MGKFTVIVAAYRARLPPTPVKTGTTPKNHSRLLYNCIPNTLVEHYVSIPVGRNGASQGLYYDNRRKA